MAAINDLINQIKDENLKERITEELEKISKQRKFGLVFENHLPECTPLYDVPIKKGSLVSLKTGSIKDLYIVYNITNNTADCVKKGTEETTQFEVKDLISVAEFGQPIYPYLKPIGSVCHGDKNDIWHMLIEADNYHALQLLEYLYAGKVDCIYIDPPYNTGAKDWKYNNDYVDGNDEYRHSKWLSMMEKRLKLAKKLLNPKDSVLIVTIDDKEYLHLGCMLEQIFPEARLQMISDSINSKGTMQRKKFPRNDEYVFFVWLGESEPLALKLGKNWLIGDSVNTNNNRFRYVTFIRTSGTVSRKKTPSMFYPIFVNEEGTKVLRVGDSLPVNQDYHEIKPGKGEKVIFPINTQGKEVIWHLTQESFIKAYNKGYIHLGEFNKHGMSIGYLPSGMQKKIENGLIPILGRNRDGSFIFNADEIEPEFLPGSQWRVKQYDATEYGTKLLQKFIGSRFSYPKSLYSTHDAIMFSLKGKPNACILDFFAGSGTTLHAVNLLNAEDGGHRRCIIVTNNEVSEVESKEFKAKGLQPGDDEWEKFGIARYVTWPRTVCSIEGHDINGNPLKGNYIGDKELPMSEGFKANCAYFKLGFLDKNKVALGRQFEQMLPTFWMKAGCIGQCPILEDESVEYMILPENRMAVLINERSYKTFAEEVLRCPEIKTIFIITDSNAGYREMISAFPKADTYQLYKDYLDNFRINTGRV